MEKKFYRRRSDLFWRCVEILCCNIDVLSYFYVKIIGKEYKKEYKIFDVGKSRRILHIGCGMFPITALTLADEYDLNIVAIDNRKDVIKTAKQIIKNKKLEKKITVEIGEGETYPLKRFDTIIISSCSIPKIKILENIFKNAKPDCKIIVRELQQERDLITDYINSNKNFLVNGEIDNYAFFGLKWKSFYFTKKELTV